MISRYRLSIQPVLSSSTAFSPSPALSRPFQSFSPLTLAIGLFLLMPLTSCRQAPTTMQPRTLNIQQNWELKPGYQVAGHRISGGLGDISIEVRGSALYAPFSGLLQPHREDCVIFSSPEVPAYLLRMCGVRQPALGEVRSGDKIGTGQTIHFAALRKQPTGYWAIVEPARDILERILSKPQSF